MCLTYGRIAYAANDDFTRATDIRVNQAVTDKMAYTNKNDYNYYKFTISENGYINMNFSHAELETTSNCWYIVLYNEERTQIRSISSVGSEKNLTSNNIGLPAGVYYICVYNGLVKSTVNYQLKINYTKTDNWEKEFNDGFTQANNIAINQSINGSMMYTNDTDYDYYKFTLSKDGYVNISFNHMELETDSNCWYIVLYNKERTQIRSVSSAGSEKNLTSNNIGLPAGMYYICVYNGLVKSTVNYQLKINYTKTDNWEKEFNDGFTQANNIAINQSINGSMMYTNDTDYDYYKFTIPKYGYIKINFTHARLETDSNCWEIGLYNKARNSLGNIMSKGSKSNTNGYVWLNAGTYYICVNNSCLQKATVNYRLNVTYSTPKASIKSVTSGSKKLTLKWKKLKGISGYQIVTATNKKFTKNKKVTTVKSKKMTKATIKKLKRKKTYYVKMRGYITVNGTKYYGSYSKVKKIKIR